MVLEKGSTPYVVVSLGVVVCLLSMVLFASPVEARSTGNNYEDRTTAAKWKCRRAHLLPCDNLLNLEIKQEVVVYSEFKKYCYKRATACAKLRMQERTCTIYSTRGITKSTLIHETNHCYGWEHKGESEEDHRKPWIVFPSFVKFFVRGIL